MRAVSFSLFNNPKDGVERACLRADVISLERCRAPLASCMHTPRLQPWISRPLSELDCARHDDGIGMDPVRGWLTLFR
jgi:hypothetical protein